MRYGTSYFRGLRDAYTYYHPYGYDRRAVNRKIDNGEIYLGPPPLKPGETATLDEDGRYVITTQEP